MKTPYRYLLAGLVALSVVLAYTGVRYKQHRRVELTAQLEKAIESYQSARAVQLLRLGADPNGRGKDGVLLVFHALDSSAQDASLIRAFVAAGVNVNAQSYGPLPGGRGTLLSQIGRYDENICPAQLEEMQCLLQAGADPNLGSQSVIRLNSGDCTEGCWSNPREVTLLLHHGAKLRKGDATAMIEGAEGALDDAGDEDNKFSRSALQMMRVCATLPLPSHERRTIIQRAIKSVSRYHYQDTLEKRRIETLVFLKSQLRTN